MTQYNSLNVNLSKSQLTKLKLAIKSETEVVLRLSLNMVANSGGETNFPHILLLTNGQVANLHKTFTIYQLAISYQKLNYLRQFSQENFLVDF